VLSRRFAFLDHPGPLAFAHRGGAAEGAENTVAAFERAVGLGYTYLETDAHATSDGVLIAFHDHTLDRVTDRRGRISELPYRTVKQARVHGVHEIPLLEDLLGTWPEIRFNIDVKEAAAIAPLAEAIRRTNSYDRICLTSFSDERRREHGNYAPNRYEVQACDGSYYHGRQPNSRQQRHPDCAHCKQTESIRRYPPA